MIIQQNDVRRQVVVYCDTRLRQVSLSGFFSACLRLSQEVRFHDSTRQLLEKQPLFVLITRCLPVVAFGNETADIFHLFSRQFTMQKEEK